MKNLPFVLWMLGWPAILRFSGDTTLHNYSAGAIITSGLILIAAWLVVGKLLYEK